MSERTPPYAFSEEVNGEDTQYIGLTDGRRIAYQKHGYGKHTIVDFHGSPGSRLSPVPRNTHLNLFDVSVITFDRPGYGKSTHNEGRKITDVAQDVEQMLDALHVERCGLTSRSGGVPYALGVAALLGDRITGMFCASGVAPRPANPKKWDIMSQDNQTKHQLARQDPAALAAQLANHAKSIRQDKAALYNIIAPEFLESDHWMLHDDAVITPRIVASHAEALNTNAAGWADDVIALNSENGWGFDCADIACPTVFWHGEQDPFSHYSHSEALRDATPGSASVIHAEMGHFGSIAQVSNSLAYVRGCASRADGSQLSKEDLTQLFAVRNAYEPPIYPRVDMHMPQG